MNSLFQLAALFSAVPEIEGRKKLQKMVHILQEFGVPFGVGFGFQHYGPFSEQLQDCFQTAQHDGLIHEAEGPGQPATFRCQADGRLTGMKTTTENTTETCGTIKPGIDAHAKWYYVARQVVWVTPQPVQKMTLDGLQHFVAKQQRLGREVFACHNRAERTGISGDGLASISPQ